MREKKTHKQENERKFSPQITAPTNDKVENKNGDNVAAFFAQAQKNQTLRLGENSQASAFTVPNLQVYVHFILAIPVARGYTRRNYLLRRL